MHDLRPEMLRSLGDDLAKLRLIDVAGWNGHATMLSRPQLLHANRPRKRTESQLCNPLSSVAVHQLPNLHPVARPGCMLFGSHESDHRPTLASFFQIPLSPHDRPHDASSNLASFCNTLSPTEQPTRCANRFPRSPIDQSARRDFQIEPNTGCPFPNAGIPKTNTNGISRGS
jgi:hypothetical protein